MEEVVEEVDAEEEEGIGLDPHFVRRLRKIRMKVKIKIKIVIKMKMEMKMKIKKRVDGIKK